MIQKTNKMIDITKAQNIPGWMSTNELTWLAEQAGTAKQIVEVGSHLGRSTRAIADHTQGRMIAVDDWFGPRDTILPHSERLKLYEQFGQNLMDSPTALAGRLQAWKIDHAVVTCDVIRKTFGDDFRADFIFVDGHHEYPQVLHDLLVWLPFLTDSGLICGHDYITGFPGVIKAVTEVVPLAQPVPGTTFWAWRRNNV